MDKKNIFSIHGPEQFLIELERNKLVYELMDKTTGGSREKKKQLVTKKTKIYIAGHRGMVGSEVW